jgi:hypothetical protein
VDADNNFGQMPADGSSTGSSNFVESSRDEAPVDHDLRLRRLLDAWPTLPAPIRAAMLALIQSVAGASGFAPDASEDRRMA